MKFVCFKRNNEYKEVSYFALNNFWTKYKLMIFYREPIFIQNNTAKNTEERVGVIDINAFLLVAFNNNELYKYTW